MIHSSGLRFAQECVIEAALEISPNGGRINLSDLTRRAGYSEPVILGIVEELAGSSHWQWHIAIDKRSERGRVHRAQPRIGRDRDDSMAVKPIPGQDEVIKAIDQVRPGASSEWETYLAPSPEEPEDRPVNNQAKAKALSAAAAARSVLIEYRLVMSGAIRNPLGRYNAESGSNSGGNLL